MDSRMVEDIKANISKLISLYESERQRADALAGQLAESEDKVRNCKEQILVLNQEIDNLRLIGAFNSAGRKSGAFERIDKLVKEIDKCIRLLEE